MCMIYILTMTDWVNDGQEYIRRRPRRHWIWRNLKFNGMRIIRTGARICTLFNPARWVGFKGSRWRLVAYLSLIRLGWWWSWRNLHVCYCTVEGGETTSMTVVTDDDDNIMLCCWWRYGWCCACSGSGLFTPPFGIFRQTFGFLLVRLCGWGPAGWSINLGAQYYNDDTDDNDARI